MQIRASQPHAGAGASALPSRAAGRPGAEICMCEIGKRGEPPAENPGRASRGAGGRPLRTRPAGRHGHAPPASRLQATPRRTPEEGDFSGPGGFSRAELSPRPPPHTSPASGSPRVRACVGRCSLGHGVGGAHARREAPPPSHRVGGSASDVSGGKSPFRLAVHPAPWPCRGILAGRRRGCSDPSAGIEGWEGASRKRERAGKEEEAWGWSEA